MSASGPLWEVTIQKQLGTEYWTNVYHVAASSLPNAKAIGDFIVQSVEKPIHLTNVAFTSMRVRPHLTAGEGTVFPIGQNGVTDAASYLPLFNTVRVDFAATSGRPSRKYYRLPLREDAQDSGQLVTSYVNTLKAHFDAIFASTEMASIVDVDGQLFVGVAASPIVAMRQLRRGSRRRVIPTP